MPDTNKVDAERMDTTPLPDADPMDERRDDLRDDDLHDDEDLRDNALAESEESTMEDQVDAPATGGRHTAENAMTDEPEPDLPGRSDTAAPTGAIPMPGRATSSTPSSVPEPPGPTADAPGPTMPTGLNGAGTATATAGVLGQGSGPQYDDDWRAVQTGFVDDPAGAVREADQLVGKLIGELVSKHRELSGRSAGAGDGEQTEQLRLALRDYRTLYRQLVPAEK